MANNTIKIVFISIILLTGVTFLTATKPNPDNVSINNNDGKITKKYDLKVDYFPPFIDLVGKEPAKKEDVFKKGQKYLLVVGSHDSLAVVKDFSKYYDAKALGYEFISVANISKAPWFIKKLVISSTLEELNEGSNDLMIYDEDGYIVKALMLDDSSKTKYYAYVVDEDGNISYLLSSDVKEGAMDGSMTDDEKKQALSPIYTQIKE